MSARRTRHKIARGALRRRGLFAAGLLVVVFAVLAAALAALQSSAVANALGSFGPLPLILGPLLPLVVGLLTYLNLPGWLELGSDGLGIDWRGSKQYVPFRELEEVAPYLEKSGGKTLVGIELRLRDGSPLRILVGEGQLESETGARSQALHLAVAAALSSYRARERAEVVDLPERGQSSAKHWLERLKGVGAGANATPRDAPVAPERLWRIAEDPAAEPVDRASAAAALSADLDPPGRERLRIAAAETASPTVRAALEHAAASDDARLVEALDAVQPGAKATRS